MQKVLREVGVEYSQRVADTLTKLAAGAKIADFPKEQRAKWANTMPNIAQDWVKRNEDRGLPARLVLKTYLDKLRAAGQTPLRDWDVNRRSATGGALYAHAQGVKHPSTAADDMR